MTYSNTLLHVELAVKWHYLTQPVTWPLFCVTDLCCVRLTLLYMPDCVVYACVVYDSVVYVFVVYA